MRVSTPLTLREMGTPPAPEAGSRAYYAKPDGRLYTRGPDGTERLAAQIAVGPTAPGIESGEPYLWVQTGLGPTGADWTLWIEDGA